LINCPPVPLEAYKYNIKSKLPIAQENHWLDIKTNAFLNEMVFSVHDDIAEKAVKEVANVVMRSYEKTVAGV
jgi:hypothetical protein